MAAARDGDFAGVIARHRQDGLKVAEAPLSYPDSKSELLRVWARQVYERYGRNLTLAAKKAGCAVNSFKGYLNTRPEG